MVASFWTDNGILPVFAYHTGGASLSDYCSVLGVARNAYRKVEQEASGGGCSARHTSRVLNRLCIFAFFNVLSHFIVGDLPTGSFTLRFDTAGWQESKSAEYVIGDITPRQKMLGDVVSHILPGRNHTEIEQLLGPSLRTPYFEETGRDLIYVLGPHRNSFIRIDSEWLLVWLDKSGQFQRYAIYTD